MATLYDNNYELYGSGSLASTAAPYVDPNDQTCKETNVDDSNACNLCCYTRYFGIEGAPLDDCYGEC